MRENIMKGTCVTVKPLVDSVLVIRGIIQHYIVRFKYTVGVSMVLKVMLDMRNESKTFGGFVPNFQRNMLYP